MRPIKYYERTYSATMIRNANDKDIGAMLAIYSPIVESTSISLEITPPTENEFRERVQKYQTKWAWLVYEQNGKVLGYAYGSPHRERLAYKWTVETSVYVSEEARGQGIGSLLYSELFSRLTELGYCSALAIIVLPNQASVAAHTKLGFKQVGILPSVGRKFNQWHDVGWFYKKLRENPPID